MGIGDTLGVRFKWAITRFFESQIQTLITERIVKFHERMVADGVIERGSAVRHDLQASPPVSPLASDCHPPTGGKPQ